MDMKNHILAALREQFERWEAFLASLSAEQIATPALNSEWTIQDHVAHLWAWQQRSIARVEAARLDREPEFPKWPVEFDPDGPGSVDPVNAWIYTTNRDRPWADVYQNWRDGFLHFLELAGGISERELLDGSHYAWLEGYSIADVLLASYDHHQEHIEMLSVG